MEWMEGDYGGAAAAAAGRGLHLSDTRQKLLTVKWMWSVMLLMHKVWKFITPHIITEHTEDPGALSLPFTSLSLLPFHRLFLAVSPSFSLRC